MQLIANSVQALQRSPPKHGRVDRRVCVVSLTSLWLHAGVARANAVYTAGSAEDLRSLIDTVPEGSVITLEAKDYLLHDTLTIEKPLTLRGVNQSRLCVQTENPYVSVLRCSSAGGPILLQGFSVSHSSPSVANNYAIYIVDAEDVCLQDLDIQSETGTGVAVEGGKDVLIKDCIVHDCASNGIGIFSSILGADASGTVIQGNRIVGNGRNGVLVKGAGSPTLEKNTVTSNKEFGFNISDSEPYISDTNILLSNTKGPMTLDSLSSILS